MITLENTKVLKGLAITLVFLAHIVGAFGIKYATPLGGIGVSIFLLLSGYGLNESFKKNKLENFFNKRLVKVYVPYIFICILDFFINKFDGKKFINNIFLMETPNFMWFIQFILINYIVFYIVNKIFKSENIKNIFWVIIGIVMFFYGSDLIAEQSFIFFIGIIVSNNKNIFEKMDVFKGIIFCILGVVALLIKQTQYIRTGNIYTYYLVETIIKNFTAIGIIILVCNKFFAVKLIEKIFVYLGNLSYELYLVHAVLFFVLKNSTNIISMMIFLVFTFIGAILMEKICNFKFRRVLNEKA